MISILAVSLCAIPIALFLYSRYVSQKPQLYVKVGTKWSELLKKNMKCMEEMYTPTWWCPFGSAQTIVRELFRSCPKLAWEREIMNYADGGESALDWLHPKDEKARADKKTPIVVFLPGITGSTHTAAYLLHAAIEANQKGWRVAVANGRGNGGVPLKTAVLYNAGSTDDITDILKMLRERYPDAKKFACGFSLGGMILFNYLAKCKSKEETCLDAAVTVSSPWDSMKTTINLERFVNLNVFNKNIAQSCLKIIEEYKPFYEDKLDWDHMMQSKTMRDFDSRFIAPAFNYESVEHYYEATSLHYKVLHVPVPTLAVTSADDCFAPVHSIPFDDVCRSENVAVCLTAHGGHTAFMQGNNPNDPGFIEKMLVDFGEMVFNHM